MERDQLFQQFLDRLNSLIVTGQVLAQERYATVGKEGVAFPRDTFAEWKMESLHLLQYFLGESNLHTQELRSEFDRPTSYPQNLVRPALGILRATLKDVSWDRFTTLRSLISAEQFAAFLDAAEHQLEAGYRLPAAVIAGSVLEQHLRRLSDKHGVPLSIERNGKMVPQAAEAINQALVKAGAYNSIKQKQITSWLGIRNSAAHGDADAFADDDVAGLIRDITRFIDEYPT